MFINYFKKRLNDTDLDINLKENKVSIKYNYEVDNKNLKRATLFNFFTTIETAEEFVKEFTYTIESKNKYYINLHLTLLKAIDSLNKDKMKPYEMSVGIYVEEDHITFTFINQFNYTDEIREYLFTCLVNLICCYYED